MNMQVKKIKARRANKLDKPVGKHWTLTRVVESQVAKNRYAFCIADDETQGFIPPPVVKRYQITEADVGAGFHAPSQQSQSSEDAVRIMGPITFDGEAEEIEVEVNEPERDYDREIDGLIEKIEDLLKLASGVDAMIENAKMLENEAKGMREQATFIHNQLTAVQEWLAKEYPVDEG